MSAAQPMMERMRPAEFFTVRAGAVTPFVMTYADQADRWIDDAGKRNVGPALRLGHTRPVVIQAEERGDLVRWLRETANAIEQLYGETTSSYRLANDEEVAHLDQIFGDGETTAIMRDMFHPVQGEYAVPLAVVHIDDGEATLAMYRKREEEQRK